MTATPEPAASGPAGSEPTTSEPTPSEPTPSEPTASEPTAGGVATGDRLARLRAAVAAELPRARADLAALVAIPSISADPARAADLDRSAAAVAELFGALGAGAVEVLTEGGAPAVVLTAPGPAGSPTVLLYAHHDVQPLGDPAAWSSDPWTATERDGRLYGRGTADDKAGVVVHLATLRALLAVDGRLPLGVTVLVEGEEESGSPSLEAFLAAHAESLAADVLVIADAANWEVGTPALTVSLRGLVDCTVELATLRHGVHSGMYGGPVPDALTALCRLMATLHDDAGDVAIPGLSVVAAPPDDGGAELPPDFRVASDGTVVPGSDVAGEVADGSVAGRPELAEAVFRADAGLLDGVELIGSGGITERLWDRPAVTVLGVDATAADEAANVLTPSARAKVSLRIPPGQDPVAAMRALTDHLVRRAPWGARVTVTPGGIGEPWAAQASGPVETAARQALSTAYGVPVVLSGSGGSIPLVAAYTAVTPGATVLVTGVEDPATRAHGTDESLHLADFGSAVLAHVLLLDALGRPGH